MTLNFEIQLLRKFMVRRTHDFRMRKSGLRYPSGLPARAIFPISQESSGGSRTYKRPFRAALLVVRPLLRNLHARMPKRCGRGDQAPYRAVEKSRHCSPDFGCMTSGKWLKDRRNYRQTGRPNNVNAPDNHLVEV